MSKYEKLTYESCCSRKQGDLLNYYKVLLTVPFEKRKQIANYILNANYRSLSMAQDIADYFSTLSFDEMEKKYNRAKLIWPDIYIYILIKHTDSRICLLRC